MTAFAYYKALGVKSSVALSYARVWAHMSKSEEAISQLERKEQKCDRSITSGGQLSELLARIDGGRRVNRIFVMGCGRSGTWLLYSLLTRVMDSYALFEEVDVARFAHIKSDKLNHLLKRDYKSYWTAHLIPRSVGIVWIVRHPFDVLTSHHPFKNSHRGFHVKPHRWNGEMDALKAFIGEARPNGIVLRYEDLVSDPDGTLQRIVEAFGQEMSASARDLGTSRRYPRRDPRDDAGPQAGI